MEHLLVPGAVVEDELFGLPSQERRQNADQSNGSAFWSGAKPNETGVAEPWAG